MRPERIDFAGRKKRTRASVLGKTRKRRLCAPMTSISPAAAPASRKRRCTRRRRPPLDPGLAKFTVRRKRKEQRPLLLLTDGERRFECRDRARHMLERGMATNCPAPAPS